jgi:hypothetical protein
MQLDHVNILSSWTIDFLNKKGIYKSNNGGNKYPTANMMAMGKFICFGYIAYLATIVVVIYKHATIQNMIRRNILSV